MLLILFTLANVGEMFVFLRFPYSRGKTKPCYRGSELCPSVTRLHLKNNYSKPDNTNQNCRLPTLIETRFDCSSINGCNLFLYTGPSLSQVQLTLGRFLLSGLRKEAL